MKPNLFRTTKDLYLNFDKDTNMIIVTGISGSGKTRTSLKLQEQYGYNLLSFDFVFDYEKERIPTLFEQKILEEFQIKYPQYKNFKENTKFKTEVSNAFFDCVSSYIQKENIKIIFDGSYFINRINYEKFKEQRIIIKRTAIIPSIFHGIKRRNRIVIKSNRPFKQKLRKIKLIFIDNIKKVKYHYNNLNTFFEQIENISNKISLKEQKEIQLEELNYIKNICTKHKLPYFLIGGTLLGAVKYKGYIPWDDDIDIALFRKDYERLIKIIENDKHPSYAILTPYNNVNYYYPYAKLTHKNTRIIENTKIIKELGVFIDIFPIDYMPIDKEKFYHRTRFIRNMIIRRMCVKNNIPKSNLVKNYNKIKIIKFKKIKDLVYNAIDLITRPLGWSFYAKLYDKIIAQNIKKSKQNIGIYWRGPNEEFAVELFWKCQEYTFENYRFSSLKNSDKYLTKVYGNYMKELPKELQKTHHQIKAFWKKQ